ncbi:MAG: hypothetical protein IJ532_07295 [Alphaproteobacteria bacterium]|nr:hypothetical protein [Alphaproteobacteria bacterium]
MKKLLFFAFLSIALCACEKEEFQEDNMPPIPENKVSDNQQQAVITKLYQVKMRRELMIPFSAYVMQINHRDYLYMIRLRFNQDLKVGDAIDFSVFSFCPNEIAKINGCDLGDGGSANQNDNNNGIGYLVATDPIEAQIKDIFSMKIRYSISFLPIDTWFIETTDGNLVFVKKSKVNVSLAPGDRIVYSRYTLYDEILTLKKL